MENDSIPGRWVYLDDYSSINYCAGSCAFHCGYNVWINPDFRPEVCRSEFVCPILANITAIGDGHAYDGNWGEDTWSVTGPWGVGGAPMTIGGDSRCSSSAPGETDPVADGGIYCWCRMTAGGLSGAWAAFEGSASNCGAICVESCASAVRYDPGFRSALCGVPSCDDAAVIADDGCSAGYALCTGTKTGGDAAGQYTITCGG
jgi:hypothetical protein